ncbi:MAG: hypothetical protein ABIV07_04040 [Polaromonas sp.]
MYTSTLKSTAGVAIVLAAALGLAGCNKKTDSSAPGYSAPASTPAPSSTPSPAVMPPASAASGAPAN